VAEGHDVVVRLPSDEYRRLKRMAAREERDPQRQAAYLLRMCLQGDGPSRKEVAGARAAG
jgi:hypothetical protein